MLHKILIGVGLVALAALSFGLSYAHLGALAIVVALAIAAIKALLVIFDFMEVGQQTASFKLALLAGLLLLITMLALVVTDITIRHAPKWSEQPFGADVQTSL